MRDCIKPGAQYEQILSSLPRKGPPTRTRSFWPDPRPTDPKTSDARSPRLVDSPEEAARIAQNLRADERIRVGTHLGAAPPIHGVGVSCLDPLGTGLRRESVGMIRALLLAHPLGIGWRGKKHGETHSGNEQSGAEACQFDRRHGRSPSCCGRGAVKYGVQAR